MSASPRLHRLQLLGHLGPLSITMLTRARRTSLGAKQVSKMAQQTRKDPRAKVLSMTVRYKSATLDEFIEHHSHDVSRGGMFIKTPQAFPPGTLLKFEVRIAEDRKVMQGVGRVVWKRELSTADADRPAGMGVKFIKLDDDSRRLIDQLLSTRRDESSAFDAEGAQGVEAEAPIGLGTEPLSAAPPKSSTEEPSFFPQSEPAELPPPEDRTVMKQAAELLQEALREVGTEARSEPKRPSAKPEVLIPADVDDKEDTKPGRTSNKPSEATSRLPEPKMPPVKSAKESGVPAPRALSSTPAKRSEGDKTGSAVTATEVAREITEKAREAGAAKVPSKSPTASARSASGAGGKEATSREKPQQGSSEKLTPAQPAEASGSASGSGRGLFWFIAVAAGAALTWWLWQPRPEPPADTTPAPEFRDTPAAVESPSPTVETATAPEIAEPSPVASAEAAVSDAATASAAPEPVASVALPATVAAPKPPTKVAVPEAVTPRIVKPKAVAAPPSAEEGDTPSSTRSEPPEPPPVAVRSAESPPMDAKPSEPRAASTEAPTANKVAPAEPQPAPPKRNAPKVETDNPY